MRSICLIIAFALSTLVGLGQDARAALLLAIGSNAALAGPQTFSLGTLSNATPSQTFTVGLRLSEGANSGEGFLDRFGLRVRITSGPATLSNAAFTGNVTGTAGFASSTLAASGTTGSASGSFGTTRLQLTTNIINLATFTITGTGVGTVNFQIEELTAATNDDFRTSSNLTVGTQGETVTDQDSSAFPNAGGFRFSNTSGAATANITAVPEPSSMLLVAGVISAGALRFRRRKSNVAA